MRVDSLTENAICPNDGQFRHQKQRSEENWGDKGEVWPLKSPPKQGLLFNQTDDDFKRLALPNAQDLWVNRPPLG